jgi:hypothetical protein
MADDARSIIEPELQIALERMATGLHRQQANLPLWVYELLEQYGEACAAIGIAYVHRKVTGPPSASGSHKLAIESHHASWDDEITPSVNQWPEEPK